VRKRQFRGLGDPEVNLCLCIVGEDENKIEELRLLSGEDGRDKASLSSSAELDRTHIPLASGLDIMKIQSIVKKTRRDL
jgi:hypothetical protein